MSRIRRKKLKKDVGSDTILDEELRSKCKEIEENLNEAQKNINIVRKKYRKEK